MDTVFPLIISEVIWGWEVRAVNAKDLYEFLWLNKSHYWRWIEKSIIWNDYAIEWEDYILWNDIDGESSNLILTVDFAKKIAMRSNSEKWEEVRKYFLECEKRAKRENIEISITPRTYEVVMQEALLLADHRVKELEKKIQIDAPKVAFATAIEWSSTSVSVWDWIKAINNEWSLKMWRNKAFDWFRKNWYLMKDNVPYQKWIDQWLFELKEWLIVTTKGQIPTFTCLLTWKWQMAFIDKIWK